MLISARARLEDLLAAMFTAEELRMELVRWRDELATALPPAHHAARASYAHEAVDLLFRRGWVGPELFDLLEQARPGRAAELRPLRDAWGGRERQRFVLEVESDDPERDLPALLDALAEARLATGDPTLRVVRVWRGSLCWLLEGEAGTEGKLRELWHPRPSRVLPASSSDTPLLAAVARLRAVAEARTVGGSAWSTPERAALDRIFGGGAGLEFRSQPHSPLQSDALERALRVAEILLALPPPPDLAHAIELLPLVLDLGGAREAPEGIVIPWREPAMWALISRHSHRRDPWSSHSSRWHWFVEGFRPTVHPEDVGRFLYLLADHGGPELLHLPNWRSSPLRPHPPPHQ